MCQTHAPGALESVSALVAGLGIDEMGPASSAWVLAQHDCGGAEAWPPALTAVSVFERTFETRSSALLTVHLTQV